MAGTGRGDVACMLSRHFIFHQIEMASLPRWWIQNGSILLARLLVRFTTARVLSRLRLLLGSSLRSFKFVRSDLGKSTL